VGVFKGLILKGIAIPYAASIVRFLDENISQHEILSNGDLSLVMSDGCRFVVPPRSPPADHFFSPRISIRWRETVARYPSILQLHEIAVLAVYTGTRSISREDVVFDCGANLGIFSVYASRRATGGMIFAFEPDPETLGYLRQNLELNACRNVTIVPAAFGRASGKLPLYMNDGTASMSTVLQNVKVSDESVMVDVYAADDFVRERGLARVDFVKMDIEAAEIDFMMGGDRLLAERPFLSIAAYHLFLGVPTVRILKPYLQSRGYKCRIRSPYFMGYYLHCEATH